MFPKSNSIGNFKLKETKKQIKKLKKMAMGDTFNIVRGRHIKVYFSMRDDSGVVRNLRFIFANTPSDGNWIKAHIKQKTKYLAEHNISFVA